ncbi:hypothetical protein BKA61DRAFT_436326, partial [Leptodontidium sp. MPI-SDFR-AT-0119]
MRLLRTDGTLKFAWVNEEKGPKYAILSHTWGEEAVVFSDMISAGSTGKIKRLCDLASIGGFKYCWIDTTCINKGSSAELGEALNSMYKWYHNSAVCYIFLEDFEWQPSTPTSNKRFRSCRWFQRGWTLQELIASRNRKFYDKNGTDISAAAEDIGIHLDEIIEKQTGIELAILRHEMSVKEVNVATRMRWAAGRETTRGEDIAFCLLGIFDIHMPILYGQGRNRAFRRLQEEILKNSSDESIFAW